MWGMLTAESFTPFLEFDFIGADGWESLGRTAADVASLTPGDKLDMRTRQVRAMTVCGALESSLLHTHLCGQLLRVMLLMCLQACLA